MKPARAVKRCAGQLSPATQCLLSARSWTAATQAQLYGLELDSRCFLVDGLHWAHSCYQDRVLPLLLAVPMPGGRRSAKPPELTWPAFPAGFGRCRPSML